MQHSVFNGADRLSCKIAIHNVHAAPINTAPKKALQRSLRMVTSFISVSVQDEKHKKMDSPSHNPHLCRQTQQDTGLFDVNRRRTTIVLNLFPKAINPFIN